MRDRRIVQLAVILQNGIEIQPGDNFPVGWDLNRNRIFAEATDAMLAHARHLRRPVMARRHPEAIHISDWTRTG